MLNTCNGEGEETGGCEVFEGKKGIGVFLVIREQKLESACWRRTTG